MADAIITSTNVGSGGEKSLMTLLADYFVESLRHRGSLIPFVNTDAMATLAAYGNTARILLAPDVAYAGAIAGNDGEALVKDNTVGTPIDIVLNQYKHRTIGYSPLVVELQGSKSTMPMQINASVTAIINAINADIAAVVTSGFSSNSGGTYNTALTDAVMRAAATTMLEKTPAGSQLYGFLKPDANAWGALLNTSTFRDWSVLGKESPIVSPNYGSMVQWHGVNWSVSQSVHKATNNTDNFIFARDAIGVAMKAPKLPDNYAGLNAMDPISGAEFQIVKYTDPSTLSEVVTVRALYGVSVLKETYGYLLKS